MVTVIRTIYTPLEPFRQPPRDKLRPFAPAFDGSGGSATISPQPLCGAKRVAFQCDIVTPDEEVFKETVTSVVLPAHDGYMGILTGRAPILLRLGAGLLTATLASGGSRAFQVRRGVAHMRNNALTVLAETAEPVAG